MLHQSTPSKIESKFLGLVPYSYAYNLQKLIHLERVDKKRCDTILGLVHHPCVTVGRLGKRGEILSDDIDIYYIERGGKSTYHGPGQLVVYFIWNIKEWGIKKYLDFLENIASEVLINLGVKKNEVFKDLNGRGVWIKNKKIVSLGIAIRKWVSFHGLSINLDKRIHSGFSKIIPCGLDSKEICCLEHFGIKTTALEVFYVLLRICEEFL